MHVTEMLDKWPEHHKRTRHWVPPPSPLAMVPRIAALRRCCTASKGTQRSLRVSPHAIALAAMHCVGIVYSGASGLRRDTDGRSCVLQLPVAEACARCKHEWIRDVLGEWVKREGWSLEPPAQS